MDKELLLEVANNIIDTMPLINRSIFNPSGMTKECLVPPSHIQVIVYLSKRESSSVSEIASVLGISRPNMTPLIDKLIAENFVERNIDPSDRRVIRVKLTESAKEFLTSHKQELATKLSKRLSSLSVEDLDLFQESLFNISNIVSKL